MTTLNVKQQKLVLKQYGSLIVKDWPADKNDLTERHLYEAKKLLKEFLNVMPLSPKAEDGGCVNIARLINLKYGLKYFDLEDFMYGFDLSKFDKYRLIDDLTQDCPLTKDRRQWTNKMRLSN